MTPATTEPPRMDRAEAYAKITHRMAPRGHGVEASRACGADATPRPHRRGDRRPGDHPPILGRPGPPTATTPRRRRRGTSVRTERTAARRPPCPPAAGYLRSHGEDRRTGHHGARRPRSAGYLRSRGEDTQGPTADVTIAGVPPLARRGRPAGQ